MELVHLLILLAILIFSCSLHEMAHSRTAAWLGDSGALHRGRGTLDPWVHVEPFWTLFMPILLFFISSGAIVFGMGRSVRVDPSRFRRPGWGNAATVFSGPMVNAIVAAAVFGLLCLIRAFSPSLVEPDTVNAYVLGQLMVINILLAVLHFVLPVPPLDGARLLRHYLGPRGKGWMDAAEPFGFLVVMLLLALCFVGKLFDPFYDGLREVFAAGMGRGYAETLVASLRGRL